MTRQTALRPLVASFAALALLLSACSGGGGGGGSGGGLSEKRAGEIAEQYVLDVFGIFTGDVDAQRLINSFAPECREGVEASDITAAAGFIALFLPDLAKAKIEDVDLGKLNFEKTDEGILVLPADPDAIRVKVDGKFINANDFFSDLGMDESEDSGPVSAEDALLIVERDGKAYLGDCSELQDFSTGISGDEDEDEPPIGLTVSGGRVSTPVPATNRPGGTRATAVNLGTTVVVEEMWRISVVAVNKDAAAAVQPRAPFFEAPAANERMVLVKIKAENVSKDDDPIAIGDFGFQLTGSRNRLYSSYDSANDCGFFDEAFDVDLLPGGQTTGEVCFRIPRDETNLLLVYEAFFEGPTYLKLD